MSKELNISNEHGRLLGRYRAVVVSNIHPKKWHMAQVRLLGLWEGIQDKSLPWAEYILPLGSRPKEGDMMPVQPDDLVWVSFPNGGDTRYPLIEGACYRVDGDGTGESLLPQDGWKVAYEHKRTDLQPPAPVHAYGDKVLDQMTFLTQLTMSGEYCLTHKKSGTAIHVNAKGELVFHVESNQCNSTTGDRTEEVNKSLIYIIDLNSDLNIGGNCTRNVKGKDVIAITGNRAVTAKNITEDATTIRLNGGKGVVQGDCICAFTGKPHSDLSSTVTAGK